MTVKIIPLAAAKTPLHVKKRLFPAALALLRDRDFHQVQVRDIAAASGVSSATIYKYFKSKEGLVIAILEDFLALVIEDIRACVARSGDAQTTFREIWNSVMVAYDKHPDVASLYFMTVPTRTWMLYDSHLLSDVAEQLTFVIETGQKAGQVDANLTATQIIGLLYSMLGREVQVWYRTGRKWQFANRTDKSFGLFWKAVCAT